MSDYGDYIADYLSGALSPEEMKEFEARLETDEELRMEYELLSKGMESLKTRVMMEEIEKDPDLPRVEAEVKAFMKGQEGSKADVSRDDRTGLSGFRKALIRAIPAAVLVGAFLLIRFFLTAEPNEGLYKKNYEPLSEEFFQTQVVRGEAAVAMQAGIDCYLAGDYACAAGHFESTPGATLYLGLSYLGLERFEEALGPLEFYLLEQPGHPVGNWYLGLACLRLNRWEEALILLNRVVDTGAPYGPRAEKLIRKIEKMKAAGTGV